MTRKRYSKDFKAKVALAAIKAQQTAGELASESGVHPKQINDWKKQAVDALPEVFGRTVAREAAEREGERDRLYQQIGRLQVELDWLKKNYGGKLSLRSFSSSAAR
ncbi:transposase [Thiorhodococcus mannitoliphagus]|uniref:Transposase n=1 Tax=Thiorhodococcus mannitoliphagus TaxID=329406 RepID=A0A6P1E3N1_9GAMM|nr:transposase [Thiorhodococcus mannitoliphagus]NEX23112.1 transposase [Thiorhodococcus mannitoliphagus]